MEGRTLSRSRVAYTELGKPVFLLFPVGTGKLIARTAERSAGKGLWKKRMPPCNAVDRGLNVTPRENGQTSTG